MHRTRRILLALAPALLFVPPALRAQAGPDHAPRLPESYFAGLKDLLGQVSQQSPRMILRAGEEAVAEGNRVIARSGQLPSIGGSLSYYPLDVQTRAGTAKDLIEQRLIYGITLTQPIYHWGVLSNNTRVAELGVKIAKGQTAEVYRALVEEIRGQYLQLIIKKLSLTRTRFNQKLADERLALVKTQIQNHAAALSADFMPTVASEQAALTTDRALEDFAHAKGYLAKLTGAPALADDQIPDEIPATKPDPARFKALFDAFSNQKDPDTYALRMLRDQIAIERLNYASASKRLWPNLNAVIGASQDQQSFTVNTEQRYQVRDVYTGIQINWSIFDGFSTRANKANSLARRRNLEENYRAQIADTIETARSQLRQIEFSARNLAIVERLFAAADNGLSVQTDTLKRGLISEAELASVQLNYYDAKINVFAARSDYLMKVCDFLSTILADPALSNLPVGSSR